MQILPQKGKPPKNRTSFRLYEALEKFKYLGTTIKSRGIITPTLKTLKKRMNICMQAIHKLLTDMIDMAT